MSEKVSAAEWLTGIVLNASSIFPSKEIESNLISMGVWGEFEIFGIKTKDDLKGYPLVSTEVFKIYVAKLSSGQLGLMKIATSSENNSILENEAKTLKKLQKIAKELDDQIV
jgi:hypothetical protein